ncbi:MAG: amidohydrolase family protein, partial [Gemmatimonadaceae bacterium]
PIRTERDREGLWTALIAGEIDLVASDHSPCPAPMKETGGDFFAAWGGIASLQISLPAVWTGARARGIEPARMAQWMSARPAAFAGLDRTKGRLAAGYDADVVVWDPDEIFVVDPAKLWHRHPITPYAGRKLYGKIVATYVRGRRVFGDGSPSSVP